MKYYIFITCTLFLLVGCKTIDTPININYSDTDTDNNDSIPVIEYHIVDPADLIYTKYDSIEAQHITIWWTDSLRPSLDTVSKFLYEVGAIRYLFSDSIPDLKKYRFDTLWKPSEVIIRFDSLHAAMVFDSTYLEWNKFDEDLRPIWIIDRQILSYYYFEIRFKGVLHPSRLADLYKNLPGVISCYRQIYGTTGTGLRSIYPFQKDSSKTYLFVTTKDLAGSTFYYFTVLGKKVGTIGYWDQQKTKEIPFWWEDALENINFMNDKL
jgi:hypothetical protein